ncbi:class I SAM-dependent methyltransferase [Chroococcidiopsis thermalis]|uniref:Methyltransferase type 11 n=1 Tax=Chroococcidiopsis thermalis (strain PCC 7203) TaxID=251229 RepID=K9U7D2_CHRTP|nr:methyltransferase domain-containing protein [Chroococcidiopsis thermalis]AFY91022.1 Methyltransferase type 11 [Chroococcidiopsis thermalis PCC 7203]
MTKTTVREQYDQMAAKYDRRWSSYITNTLSFLQDWTQISPQDKVLDIACGTGEFERLVLTQQPMQEIIGVDISEKMLAIAREKLHAAYPNVSFHSASATALPFPDNSFDVVVSASSFHYFEDPVAALVEMKRVLKPNGRVIILDWCKDYLLCRLCDLVLKFFDPAYQQCYTETEFHHLLELAGFDIHRATKFRFNIVWGMMIATATPRHN